MDNYPLLHKAPADYDNISEAMRAFIDAIHAAGLDAYMRHAGDTWAYFTDGTRIGCVANDRFEGPKFTTAHKPNKTTGTGFAVQRRTDGPITAQDLEDTMAFAPGWANSRDLHSVVKWANWAQFHSANSFNQGYVKIATV